MRAKVLSGMTALTSFSRPSAPYILPPARIIAGIDASTMTSLGEWKLVMPLAESTIASSGRCSWQACRSRLISSRCDSGSVSILLYRSTMPLLTLTPEAVEQLGVLLERFLVEDAHAVAEHDRVRDLHHRRLDVQREHHAGLARVLDLAARRSRSSAFLLMNIESMISPSCSATLGFEHDRLAALGDQFHLDVARALQGQSTSRRDRSRRRACATRACARPGAHSAIECGFLRAYSFTARGARRSELPSRSTGLTAEPMHLP